MTVKLHLERTKNPSNEFAIEDDYAMDLGLVVGTPSGDSLTGKDRVVIADAYMTSDMTKKVYLKDLFFSGHPAIVKRSYTEIVFGGGFGGGGTGRRSTVERLRYDDIVPTIVHTNNLNNGKHYLAGTSDGRQAVFGGGSGSADLIQKLKFDDSIPAVQFTNRLSTSKRGLAGAASFGEALFGGGVTDVSAIDKVKFDDSAMVVMTNGLSVGRHYVAAGSDRNQICFAGGVNSSAGPLSSIERFRYDDIVPSYTLSNSLTVSRNRLSGGSTEFEMIFTGDNNSATNAPQFEKTRFDDSVFTAVFVNTYSQPVHSGTAQSNGFDTLLIAGGNVHSGDTTDTVESVKFDDSAHAIHTNLLSESKYGLASAQGY